MSTVAPHVSQLLFCASVRGGEEIKARGEFVLLSPSPHTPTRHPFSTPPSLSVDYCHRSDNKLFLLRRREYGAPDYGR